MPSTTAVYTTKPGTLSGPLSVRRSGVSSFYVPDFQGHSRQLADASQTVTDTFLADAWGKEVASTGTTVNPYKQFGKWGYQRDAANRQYVRARHLRNDLGRWVGRDPILRGQGGRTYDYCVGNPLRMVDPLGLDQWEFGSHIPEPVGRYGDLPKRGWGKEDCSAADFANIIFLRAVCAAVPQAVIEWFARLLHYSRLGDESVRVICHWVDNTGDKLLFDIEKIWKSEPQSRQACTENLIAAAKFAEANVRPGPGGEGWIRSQWVPRNGLTSFDYWWATGGHSAYGQAWAVNEGNGYYAFTPFNWVLTDTDIRWQTKGGPDWLSHLFKCGLACDFWADAPFSKIYCWKKGDYILTPIVKTRNRGV